MQMPMQGLGSLGCILVIIYQISFIDIQSSKESRSDQSSLCFVSDIKAMPSAVFISDFQSLVERNPMHAV